MTQTYDFAFSDALKDIERREVECKKARQIGGVGGEQEGEQLSVLLQRLFNIDLCSHFVLL